MNHHTDTDCSIAAQVNEGDIFVSMWGYEETITDFYQIVRMTPKCAYLQPIESHTVANCDGAHVFLMPDKDVFLKDAQPRRCKLRFRNGKPYFLIGSLKSYAYPWDGSPKRGSNGSFIIE